MNSISSWGIVADYNGVNLSYSMPSIIVKGLPRHLSPHVQGLVRGPAVLSTPSSCRPLFLTHFCAHVARLSTIMAHLLRGKQAGVQKDLSLGITPEFFAIDDVGYRPPFIAPTDKLDHSWPAMESTPKYLPSHTIRFNLCWLLGPRNPNLVLV